MSCIFIIAIIVEVTAQSYWQVVIGRFFNYIPMGVAGALVPVYQVSFHPHCLASVCVLTVLAG